MVLAPTLVPRLFNITLNLGLKELDALAAAHADRLQVQYLVEQPANSKEESPCSSKETSDTERHLVIGRVSVSRIENFLPAPSEARTALLVCGPPGMMHHLCGSEPPVQGAPPTPKNMPLGGLLKQMGYGRQVVRFD